MYTSADCGTEADRGTKSRFNKVTIGDEKMKLRNFLYLNTKIVDDYLAALEGYVYDEEVQEISNSTENTVKGGGKIKIASGEGSHVGKSSEAVNRSVKISDAAKFDKVFKYLEAGDEDEQIKYYEFLTDDEYNNLRRDDFLEVLVTARFSKMKELTDTVKKFSELANVIQGITEQPVLDKEAQEAVTGFSALGKLKSGKEIACVFNFEDGKFPLIAHLDENYFKCEQENFVGEAYVVCKVLRKIPKGKSVKLDEIFDDLKKIPMNRQQRRNMPKNMDNPEPLRDVIKGPALMVVPIAVYQ